jgi:AraC-like DNA-binding protein
MNQQQATMRSLGDKARMLMRPNASRDGFSLEQTAEMLHVSPRVLDQILWRTNGGVSLKTFLERRAEFELCSTAPAWKRAARMVRDVA